MVIFPPAADVVSTGDPGPLGLAGLVATAPDRCEPSKNDPISSPAAATPIPIARGTGFIATIMATLPVLRPAASQTRAGSRRFRCKRLSVLVRDHVEHDEDDGEKSKRAEDPGALILERGNLPDPRCQLARHTFVEGEVPADEERESSKHGDVERGLLAHGTKNGTPSIVRQRQMRR